MWTDENHLRYDRDKLCYPSYLTDDEWAHIESLILPASPTAANGASITGLLSSRSRCRPCAYSDRSSARFGKPAAHPDAVAFH